MRGAAPAAVSRWLLGCSSPYQNRTHLFRQPGLAAKEAYCRCQAKLVPRIFLCMCLNIANTSSLHFTIEAAEIQLLAIARSISAHDRADLDSESTPDQSVGRRWQRALLALVDPRHAHGGLRGDWRVNNRFGHGSATQGSSSTPSFDAPMSHTPDAEIRAAPEAGRTPLLKNLPLQSERHD